MTVLLRITNSSGFGGQCDAKCYNAETENCNCVCGGLNHGKGEKRARKNTALYSDFMVNEYSDAKGIKDILKVKTEKQLSFF